MLLEPTSLNRCLSTVRPRESGDPVQQTETFVQAALGSRFRGNERRASRALTRRYRAARKHRLDLVLKRLRVEGLDDVVVDASPLGRENVFGLGFRRDHDE